MSGPCDSLEGLYRERAFDRALHSMRRLLRLPAERQLTSAARTLERAAGALAVITAAYSPRTEIADRWEKQIEELLTIAASLQQTADVPDNTQCTRGET